MKKSSVAFIALFAFLSVLTSGAVFAQQPTDAEAASQALMDKSIDSVVRAKGPNAADVPVLVKIKGQGGDDLEYDYVGNQFGTDVWLISGDKVMQMIHVMPSGAAVIGGTMVSPEGQEISSALQKSFADEKPERAKIILERVRATMEADQTQANQQDAQEATKHAVAAGEMIWGRMKDLAVVQYGAEKDVPVMYMVADPTDAASKAAIDAVMVKADAGKIDLRIVPISLSSPDAIMSIGLIMAASDPGAALKGLLAGTPPAAGAEPPKPEAMLKLKNNADFVEALKLNKLPSIFYRKSDKDPIRVVKGAPKDWSSIFKELNIE